MSTQSSTPETVATKRLASSATDVSSSSSRVAAFFDLDGTLLPLPPLERHFFRALRMQRAIPPINYFLWLAQAVRLALNGIGAIAHTNKLYLRNVPAIHQALASGNTDTLVYAEPGRVCASPNEGLAPSTRANPAPLPRFFPQAIDRIAWHITQGHAIVLVTGTLAPLASEAASSLIVRLLARGTTTSIAVCATRLEEQHGRWTGRICGEAIFGEAKVRAVRKFAAQNNLDLARSYAYADGTHDRWMLGAVGQPAAVNPSRELERIAHLRNWPILRWKQNVGQHAIATPKTPRRNIADGHLISRSKTEILR